MTNTVLRPNNRKGNYSTFDHLFNDIFSPASSGVRQASLQDRVKNTPALANVFKTDKGHTIEMTVPGFTKEDIQISLNEGRLVVKGARNETKETKYVKREFMMNDFERAFHLPQSADLENIDAAVENGILKIGIPNMPEKQPLKILVK